MDNIAKTPTIAPESHEEGAKTPAFKPAESVVVPSTPTPKTTNIPIEQYKSENDNKPYSEKFFALNTPFNYLPSQVQSKLKDIDKFINREIADRGWKHNTNAYEQVLSDTLLELGEIDGSTMDQIDRIHGYASSILKLDGIDDVRKSIKNRLRKLQTKKDMDNLILQELGKKIL